MSGQPAHHNTVGYLSSTPGGSSRWHYDPACTRIDGAIVVPVPVGPLFTLDNWTSSQKFYPCQVCATALILDTLYDSRAGSGHHVVSCTYRHQRAACSLCAALVVYATDRRLPLDTAGSNVSILCAGAPEADFTDLCGLFLTVRRVASEHPPPMTSESFALANVLHAAGTELGAALGAASALHAPPVRRVHQSAQYDS